MNACMHDLCYTNGENMVRFKSIKLESRVNTPFGRNYGFICTCISGSTKFPKSNSFRILSGYGTTPGSTSFVRKSRLSVVSRNNQFKTTLDQPPHYVLKGQDGLNVTKGPQHRRSLENNNANHDYSCRHNITSKRPSLSVVISHVPKPETYSRYGTLIIPPSYLKFPSSSGV